MKRRNGFTLIELLAIIIILSIIAVITVPIVLNIIDDSQKNVAIDSAYLYRDALNKFYLNKVMNDKNYDIDDGEYDISYFVSEGLDVSGEKPSAGWVMIENAEVTDFSFIIGDYAVTYNSTTNNIDAVKNGEIVLTPKSQAMKDAKDKVSAYLVSVTTSANTKNYDEDQSFTVVEIVSKLSVQKTQGFDDSSWVYLKYNSEVSLNNMGVTNYSFKVTEGDFTFIIEKGNDGNPYITSKAALSPKFSVEFLNNIASYDSVEVVYYNPIDGVMNCTDYDSDNSTPGYKGVVPETNTLEQTKCLKWYKYSTNTDGTVNMILDHNIETGQKYYSSHYNSYGPVNLMQYLTLSEWEGVPTRSDKYIAYVDNSGTKTPVFTNATGNAVNYIGKKARLITAQEIAEITGTTWNEQSTSSGWFYLEGEKRNSSKPSNYYWLFENLKDCVRYGCVNEYNDISSGNSGYWTSSPDVSTSSKSWYMDRIGYLFNTSAGSTNYGVRPVITVLASEVFGG